jgi:hypothetical protein
MPDAPVMLYTDSSTLHEQHVLQRHDSAFITTYYVCQTLMDMQRFGIAWADASMFAYAAHAIMAGHADIIHNSQLLQTCSLAVSCQPY